MSGRRAYSGASAGEIMGKVGLNAPSFKALTKVRIDGEPLASLENTLRTPLRFEVRPEKKYSEAFAAAVAFGSCMRLGEMDISSVHPEGSERERPDLLVSTADHIYDVEVVRVDETYATRAHLFKVEARIAALLADEPDLRLDYPVQFTVEYDSAKHLTQEEFQQLGDELCDFFRQKRWSALVPGIHSSVFAAGSVARRVGLMVRVERPLYAAVLSLAQADEMAPYPLILDAIAEKRKLQYARSHELWLVVEIADPRGPFTKAIRAVEKASPQISPFDHVIVYDPFPIPEIPTHVIL